MATILMLYSTTDGHTLTISRHIQAVLENHGDNVRLMPIAALSLLDPDSTEIIVIGASIRYGRHNREVYEFINRNHAILNHRPSAFFSVNLVARKPAKRSADTNPYVRRFLRQIAWTPGQVGVFAGKLDYPRYGFFDRWVIRAIMAITGGPTDPRTVEVFTDWQAVDAFAQTIAGLAPTTY